MPGAVPAGGAAPVPGMIRDLEAWPPGAAAPQAIRVTIGEPYEEPPHWRCLLEISGIASPYSMVFPGADALDAFLSAVSLVPHVLRASVPRGTRITWQGAEELGFVVPTLKPTT